MKAAILTSCAFLWQAALAQATSVEPQEEEPNNEKVLSALAAMADVHPEGLVYEGTMHPNLAFFAELDVNRDMQIERLEVNRMLRDRPELSDEDIDKLFKEEDKDHNGALNMVEYKAAMEKWVTSCSAVHRSWFCSGSTRINCCRRGWTWARCGSAWHGHAGCGGGGGWGNGFGYGGGAGAWHAGGWHAGGGGGVGGWQAGGVHGPYGGGAWHAGGWHAR
eukprot:CAMPEP_0206427690 /NCGR_PEP_ID=MMETSP0324_2-20121206/5193_1 /ASSEMBLY_ACC=CAM_ASM_000836 /TAXON_ID=2866 /ORGANISM="Crypthecodinium cohnii, Strain Seligo" /LENGTH=219 /DNA_ID=CAMNT_0053893023 /DNA_START=85 /DNA_END=744 /DNA_ORIENTATION=+